MRDLIVEILLADSQDGCGFLDRESDSPNRLTEVRHFSSMDEVRQEITEFIADPENHAAAFSFVVLDEDGEWAGVVYLAEDGQWVYELG